MTERPLYQIDERPSRWWESILYGWQHTLVDISPFVLPLAVAGALQMTDAEKGELINLCLFSMGIATLIQTTIGNRLPIVQGPSATLTGVLTPIAAQFGAAVMWGGIFVGALAEALVGLLGLLRFLRRLIPAPVAGVVITVIGISLGRVAIRLLVSDGSAAQLLCGTLVVFLILSLQVWGRTRWGGLPARAAIFASIWLVGLGLGGPLGLVAWDLVAEKPWIQVPRLFPYGAPFFGWELAGAAVVGILAGYAGSMVESVGDYSATCTVAGVSLTERHINRGLFAEGLGCLAASCLGGLPCTSYTQNVGIIAATRVASRFVVQVAAVILLLYGLCPKFGALLVAIPRSVLGGVFLLVCGMIAYSGVNLIKSSKASPSDTMVVGLTLVVSLGLPFFAGSAGAPEWLSQLPTLVRLVLTNSVVLAILLAVGLNLLLEISARPDGD